MIVNNNTIEAYEIVKGKTIPSFFYSLVELIDAISVQIQTEASGAKTFFVYDKTDTRADETHVAIIYMLNENFKLVE
jgi:predicted RecB family nuclease